MLLKFKTIKYCYLVTKQSQTNEQKNIKMYFYGKSRKIVLSWVYSDQHNVFNQLVLITYYSVFLSPQVLKMSTILLCKPSFNFEIQKDENKSERLLNKTFKYSKVFENISSSMKLLTKLVLWCETTLV